MRLQVSNNAVTGWLQLAGDASIFIMNEQLYPVGFVFKGHSQGSPMRVAYLCAARTKHSLCSLMRFVYLWPAATGHALRLLMAFGHTAQLRLLMAFGHTAQLRCSHTACAKQSLRRLCASLTYVLRTRHPCLFSNEIHFVQLTFLQQLRKVSKRSRSPTNFLIHILNRLQCQNGER